MRDSNISSTLFFTSCPDPEELVILRTSDISMVRFNVCCMLREFAVLNREQ